MLYRSRPAKDWMMFLMSVGGQAKTAVDSESGHRSLGIEEGQENGSEII